MYDTDESAIQEKDKSVSLITSENTQTNKKPFNILLVEDTTSDTYLIRIALNATGILYNLHIIQRGNEVLPWLLKCQKKDRSELPDVIMLDLGLPCINGFEILAELSHSSAALRAIPIIILTGLQHFNALCKTDNLWIPAYLNKPCSPEQLKTVLANIRLNLRN